MPHTNTLRFMPQTEKLLSKLPLSLSLLFSPLLCNSLSQRSCENDVPKMINLEDFVPCTTCQIFANCEHNCALPKFTLPIALLRYPITVYSVYVYIYVFGIVCLYSHSSGEIADLIISEVFELARIFLCISSLFSHISLWLLARSMAATLCKGYVEGETGFPLLCFFWHGCCSRMRRTDAPFAHH